MKLSFAGTSAVWLALITRVDSTAGCNDDNCLRALRAIQTLGQLETSKAFCASFTAGLVASTAIPTYVLDGCKANRVEDTDLRIVSACSCIATPSITSNADTPTAACFAVSSSWASQIAPTPRPTVNAKLAYDCINSVPLDKAAALKFVDELKPYLEWQSDLAFLKDPPTDYFFPSHDIFAALDDIRDSLEGDKYSSEYAWQKNMFIKVFGPAHDGHLYVNPDILTNAMEWIRPFALVSISEDGVSPPVIKVYDDVISSMGNAPVLSLINSVDAATFIKDQIFAVTGSQDADSAYNSMFYAKALDVSNNAGFFKHGGRTRYIYPGEFTSFTFDNGTFLELPNVARLKGDWHGVVDGTAFFNRFAPGAGVDHFTPVSATSAAPSSTPKSAPLARPTGVKGYPTPVVVSSDSAVSGYFIDEPDFQDVAVLALMSFGPKNPAEFQKVVGDFFVDAARAGKTKLVVDLQVNYGGYIFQGYDTFRQIFPDIVQEGTGRWRYSPGFKALSEVFSKNCEGYDPDTASEELIQQCESVYNWGYDLDRDLEDFASYKDKFPTTAYKDDEYTELLQWNFENPLDTINSTYGIGYDVTGYGSRRNYTRPFGGPENIVLLHDGSCASTCTLFSQFMKWDAGVKSIAMGGRPEIKGKIQGVGGVKGSQTYSFRSVYGYAQIAKQVTNDSTLLAELNRFTMYVDSRASSTSINVKDEILRQNWEDGTPAQFITEYSDCRLYWQADMHRDITKVWKAAAEVAFKGRKCAFGAIDHTTSLTAKNRAGVWTMPFTRPRIQLRRAKMARRTPAANWDLEISKSWTFEANHHMLAEN